MARNKNGILGGFSGKVGTVVGYNSYGVDWMRGLPERTAPATIAEMKNRAQFKLVQDTLNCCKELIKVGFNNYWTKTGGMRGAVSYNKMFAVKEEENGYTIDPEEFKFSGGSLPGLKDVKVALEGKDVLRFHWDMEIGPDASAQDQVMMLAIDLEGRKSCYVAYGGFRNSGTDVLRLSDDLAGKEVHVYMAVIARDRSRQSNSQYSGMVVAK
ncbi:hypothetical protein SAMN05421820_102328 [Pedobacter steynii]|uniref:Uncharacterized protein n=1 Tax=Pedobacter steynii TaxID=430522 RepID=A0A1G9NIP5_9SPHI|nr:DUF6266 family protein [Pedobacter steynii]NQX39301.1 hypothetical protein [Pedobacter steynii]SDL85867.1 hypothetical protein SAMN05421820_102328 [Pedobacter steynii]